MALPREEDGLKSSYYNSLTTWIDIDGLLTQFGLDRNDILQGADKKIRDAVHQFSRQLPTYVTIKDVKKRWGNGQEDVHPVAQYEKVWSVSSLFCLSGSVFSWTLSLFSSHVSYGATCLRSTALSVRTLLFHAGEASN